MSIIIQNISDEKTPIYGENKYAVRINRKVICEFVHDRGVGALAQCLRDAADAVDTQEKDHKDDMKNILLAIKNG